MNKEISICLSPAMGHLYRFESKLVVIADIYRATSCMVTGLHHGIEKIVPVAQVEQVEAFKKQGFLVAGERNGIKVDGFDMGNSPFDFSAPEVKNRSVVMTTTNGTQAIEMAKNAEVMLIGAFLNLEAIVRLVETLNMETIIVCAGWKGRYSLEDSLFAGALASRLLEKKFITYDDATLATVQLYGAKKDDLVSFVSDSNHAHRLRQFTDERDILFCLEQNVFETIPILKEGALVAYRATDQ